MSSHFTQAPSSGQQATSRNLGIYSADEELVSMPSRHKKARRGRPPEPMFALAMRLRDAINRTDFRYPFSSLDWSREFEALVKDVGAPRVEQVLTWFCRHIMDRYTPRIRSAGTFRKRFADLEEAMARAENRRPDSTVELSAESRYVLNRLRMLHWPNGSDDQLPAVVEQSFRNLQSWYRRMVRARVPDHMEGDRRQLLDMIGSYEDYLEQWFYGVWKRFHNWDRWDGDMGPHVWTPHHERFVNAARARADLDSVEQEVRDGAPS